MYIARGSSMVLPVPGDGAAGGEKFPHLPQPQSTTLDREFSFSTFECLSVEDMSNLMHFRGRKRTKCTYSWLTIKEIYLQCTQCAMLSYVTSPMFMITF